jgi:hypothetical protein
MKCSTGAATDSVGTSALLSEGSTAHGPIRFWACLLAISCLPLCQPSLKGGCALCIPEQ